MTNKSIIDRNSDYDLQLKYDISAVIDRFFSNHSGFISNRDWSILINEILDIINAARKNTTYAE